MEEQRRPKVTIHKLKTLREQGKKAVFITSYDYPTASFVDRAGVDMILVGDSGGMTMLGYSSTVPVTMDEMIMMASAVTRTPRSAFVIGDMPFNSYQPSDETAIRSAARFLAEAGCDAVKCEGGVRMVPRIRAMVDAGIPVMGHLGLTPQNMSQLGGYRVQGRTVEGFKQVLDDAYAVQDAGAFAILLEGMPSDVAGRIRDKMSIPIYGIGAGVKLDGQLVVVHDILGSFVGDIKPRFVKRYANLSETIVNAVTQYALEVREGKFPSEEHFYPIEAEDLKRIMELPQQERDGL